MSLNLPQNICAIAPAHVPNAACCSGLASPVWNPTTGQCDTTCDPSDRCVGVVCAPLDQCHTAGTCDSATGVCSNPTALDGTGCDDGNTCTASDSCSAGACIPGTPLGSCCGNGLIDGGEECDDGNQAGADGCGAGCLVDDGWLCAGQPSGCCRAPGAFLFELPQLDQNQCESISGAPNAGCCEGSHRGVWTGVTCNVVCSVNLCLGVVCPPSGDCTWPGVCDPNTGLCEYEPFVAGAECGDPDATLCSGRDRCDGAGNCLPNDALAGTACTTDCGSGQCDGAGTCSISAVVPDGTTCDDDDLCTAGDACVSGQCASGTPVVCDLPNDCLQSQCFPSIGCTVPTPIGLGTVCGDAAPLGDCDAGDTCDDQGHCLQNMLGSSVVCRVDAGECDVEERCDGATPTCPADGFEPGGTACGDPNSTPCTAPDQCDGAGTCQPRDLPCTTTSTTVVTTSTTTSVPGTSTTSTSVVGASTTSTSVVATSTTSTTLAPPGPCDGVVGIARARCLIGIALADELCSGETLPKKVDRALRAWLTKADRRLEKAEGSEGKKLARFLKKARGALATVDRKTAAARKADRISEACGSTIGELAGAIGAALP